MAFFLKGIGDRLTGKNEILPQLDARILHLLTGDQHGIISGELNSFGYTTIDRGVRIKSGLVEAYGYFGMNDTDVQFNFVMPSSQTQYVQVYAEIDLGKVPQQFEIKVTSQSNTNSFSPTRDNLKTNPSGKYQFWLYTVNLYTTGSISLTDRRSYVNKPLHSVNAENLTGTIESSVTATTQAQSDNSKRVATTSYVRQAISDAFNITQADIKTSAGEVVGTVRRHGNFVICEGDAYGSDGTGITATIPEGFRPKETITIGVSGSFIAQSSYPSNLLFGGTSGQVSSNGTLTTSVASASGQYIAVAYMSAKFFGGWEIT